MPEVVVPTAMPTVTPTATATDVPATDEPEATTAVWLFPSTVTPTPVPELALPEDAVTEDDISPPGFGGVSYTTWSYVLVGILIVSVGAIIAYYKIVPVRQRTRVTSLAVPDDSQARGDDNTQNLDVLRRPEDRT